MEKITMTVKEMASRLGVSRVKAYQLVNCEGFPKLRVGTRILIPVQALNEWVAEQVSTYSNESSLSTTQTAIAAKKEAK